MPFFLGGIHVLLLSQSLVDIIGWCLTRRGTLAAAAAAEISEYHLVVYDIVVDVLISDLVPILLLLWIVVVAGASEQTRLILLLLLLLIVKIDPRVVDSVHQGNRICATGRKRTSAKGFSHS